jgi:thiaminase/transcriptional activator TenA
MWQGTLPVAAYKRYIAQDAFFLDSFARAYALALAHSPDTETMQIFQRLLNTVFAEKRMHVSAARRLDIRLDRVVPYAATLAYTDFLLATAWRSEPGETTAAMTPCLRLYAYLGGELANDLGPRQLKNHPYREWIETYSSREFHAAARELEELLDLLASERPAIRRAYRYAMERELEFFSAPLEQRR